MTTTAATTDNLASTIMGTKSTPQRLGWWVAVGLLLIAFGGSWTWWEFFAMRQAQQFDVVSFDGQVTINGTAAELWGSAQPATGVVIETGPDSFAHVGLSDGSTIAVSPNSRVHLNEAQANKRSNRFDTQMSLDVGEITSHVVKGDGAVREVSLISNAVAIGVRGTVFTVTADPQSSRLMVTRGKVAALGNIGDEVLVKRGEGTVITVGQAPTPPTQLPTAPELIAPVKGAATGGGSLRLTWSPVTTANEYLVEVARDEQFLQVITRHNAPTAAPSLQPMERDGDYYWRVASIDAQGLRGEWSDPAHFVHDYYYQEGRAALQDLKAEDALALFSNSEFDYTPELDNLRSRAITNLRHGRFQEALDELSVVGIIRPDDLDVRNSKGRALVGLSLYDEARREFETVTERDATNPTASLGLGLLDFREAKFDRSLRLAQTALDSKPESIEALQLAAITSVNTNDLEQARRYLARIIKLDPTNPTARVLSRTLTGNGTMSDTLTKALQGMKKGNGSP